jgi:hypothetical protein
LSLQFGENFVLSHQTQLPLQSPRPQMPQLLPQPHIQPQPQPQMQLPQAAAPLATTYAHHQNLTFNFSQPTAQCSSTPKQKEGTLSFSQFCSELLILMCTSLFTFIFTFSLVSDIT